MGRVTTGQTDPMHLDLTTIPTPEIAPGDPVTIHLKGKTLVVRGKMMEEILRAEKADLTVTPLMTPDQPSEEPVDLTTLMLETLAEDPPTAEQIRQERTEALNRAVTRISQEVLTTMGGAISGIAETIKKICDQIAVREPRGPKERLVQGDLVILERWLADRMLGIEARNKALMSRLEWMTQLTRPQDRTLVRPPEEWARILALNLETLETELNPNLATGKKTVWVQEGLGRTTVVELWNPPPRKPTTIQLTTDFLIRMPPEQLRAIERALGMERKPKIFSPKFETPSPDEPTTPMP